MNCGHKAVLHRPNGERSPSQTLTAQFGMTLDEADMIIRVIQDKDPSLASLKHPKVMEMITQRKGRWSREEEDFANFLCKEFYLGVSPIDSGVTRRAYLASQLACTKMRISKKLKGKSKDVFRRKSVRPDGQPFSPMELQLYQQRHSELEKRFIKTALKSVINFGVRSAHKERSSQPPPKAPVSLAMAASVTTAPGAKAPAPSFHQLGLQQPVMNQPLLHASFVPTQPNLGPLPQMNARVITTSPTGALGAFHPTQAIAYSQMQATSNATPSHLPQLNILATMNTTAQPNNVLQSAQPYENQLNPMIAAMNDCIQPISPSRMSAFQDHAIGGHPPVDTANQVKNDCMQLSPIRMSAFQDHAVGGQQQGTVGGYPVGAPTVTLNAGNSPADGFGVQSSSVAAPMTSVGHQTNIATTTGLVGYPFSPLPGGDASHAVSRGSSQPPSNDGSEISFEGSSPVNLSGDNNEIPDLLSGFDRHAASLQSNAKGTVPEASGNRVIPESSHFFAGAGGVAESPYITSKSFDDLHRLLGQGLSTEKMPHLDLAGPAVGADSHQLPGVSQPRPPGNASRKYGRQYSNYSDLTA